MPTSPRVAAAQIQPRTFQWSLDGGVATITLDRGLDRFFASDEAYVAQRSGLALELIQAGFAEQLCLGHDASPAGHWGKWRTDDTSVLWTAVPNLEVGWLRANGATDAQVDAVMAGSIRATFQAAAAMAGR